MDLRLVRAYLSSSGTAYLQNLYEISEYAGAHLFYPFLLPIALLRTLRTCYLVWAIQLLFAALLLLSITTMK